jgi:hypothetical protein
MLSNDPLDENRKRVHRLAEIPLTDINSEYLDRIHN